MSVYIAIFYTHSGAVKFDHTCRKKGIQSRLMPVPRKFSSNCGIGAQFIYSEQLDELIDEEIEKIFRIEGENNLLVYESEE